MDDLRTTLLNEKNVYHMKENELTETRQKTNDVSHSDNHLVQSPMNNIEAAKDGESDTLLASAARDGSWFETSRSQVGFADSNFTGLWIPVYFGGWSLIKHTFSGMVDLGLHNITPDFHGTKLGEIPVSFEDALEIAGSGTFQHIVTIIGGLIIFCSYLSVSSIALILPSAQCDLNMDSEKKGQLASVGFIGLLIGCYIWGFLSDTLGRKYVLIRCLAVDGLLYFVTSLMPYYSVILVLRLLNGFVSSGGVASIYAYIGEFQTDKNRTKALMIASVIASCAYFFMPAYGWLILPGQWKLDVYPGLVYKPWRLFYAGSGIPSLLCALLVYFLPESPKFLLAKGDSEKATQVLKRINKINKGHSKGFPIKRIRVDETERVAKLADGKNKVAAFFRLMWDQTVPLFRDIHRTNIILVCVSQYLVYFSNGGIYFWLPEIMIRLAYFREETGNEGAKFCEIVEYGVHRAGLPPNETNQNISFPADFQSAQSNVRHCSEDIDFSVFLNLGTFGFIQFINLVIITALLRICNKKYLLWALVFGGFLSLVAIWLVRRTQFAIYDSGLLIVFTSAAIPMINSVVVDLFPTNLRAMAGCLTLMSARLGTVTTNLYAGMMIDSCCNEFIMTFVTALLVCLITVGLLPRKTPLPNKPSLLRAASSVKK